MSVDHGKTRRLQLGLRLTRSPPRCSVASDPGIYLQRGLARQACYSNDFDTVAGHAGWRIIYHVESSMKIDEYPWVCHRVCSLLSLELAQTKSVAAYLF